jgi:hypothetical protein
MRSPGSRFDVERLLRAISLAAMIALAWRLWTGQTSSGDDQPVPTAALDSVLVRWTVAPPARAIVDAATIPGPQHRDWLVALRRTGLELAWTTVDSSGVALVVEGAPLAGAPSRVTAIGPPGRDAVLFDDLGLIDSSAVGQGGVVAWRASLIGSTSVRLSNTIATAAVRDSLVTRPVLVIGQAGWESRFVVTALEEIGWAVLARLSVAPGAVVRQGRSVPIDTASLSAVVVLDSVSPLDGADVSRFVRQGGGVIASGAGVRHAALRGLLPRVGQAAAGEIGALLGPSPRNGLSTRTFVATGNVVPLERRGNEPVVLARRVGSGRVVATGFDDTWRLRMIPASESAPEAHRTWWSSLVSGVALARPLPRDVGGIDEAPVAAMVDALGPPLPPPGAPTDRGSPWPWNAWLAAVAAVGLLAEWLSRRLRGVA